MPSCAIDDARTDGTTGDLDGAQEESTAEDTSTDAVSCTPADTRELASGDAWAPGEIPCDPFDPDAPCASNERCTWGSGQYDWWGPLGLCVPVSTEPLPGLHERCLAVSEYEPKSCRAGLSCMNDRCIEHCVVGVRAPSCAACSGGEHCYATYTESHGFCARDCDPRSAANGGCETWEYCTVSHDGPEMWWGCLPRPGFLIKRGGRCDAGFCDTGLVCSKGLSPHCRTLCARPDECAEGEHCFGLYGEWGDGLLLPYGFCERPCEPGAGDCGRGDWCEPRELDPATGRWLGTCG